jgi:hypothetical protein
MQVAQAGSVQDVECVWGEPAKMSVASGANGSGKKQQQQQQVGSLVLQLACRRWQAAAVCIGGAQLQVVAG